MQTARISAVDYQQGTDAARATGIAGRRGQKTPGNPADSVPDDVCEQPDKHRGHQHGDGPYQHRRGEIGPAGATVSHESAPC